MQSITGDDNAKFAAYKRISNRQAENMADFVARMQPEITNSWRFYPIIGLYGRTMVLLPESV
jgi:hypothetical protein